MNLKKSAQKLKEDIPALMIALKYRETPKSVKLLAAVVIIYALSPIDLIPDFIPVIGYLDDLIILPVLVAITIKLIPIEILERARIESASLDDSKKKWYFAIPFMFIWIVILLYMIKIVM